eukprot:scaffold77766_cov19-Tisochrysis_lutea.AAC.1
MHYNHSDFCVCLCSEDATLGEGGELIRYSTGQLEFQRGVRSILDAEYSLVSLALISVQCPTRPRISMPVGLLGDTCLGS